MAWHLKVVFESGHIEEVDREFKTKKEALEEYQDWVDNWSAGASTLAWSDDGEDYLEDSIEDYIIWKD